MKFYFYAAWYDYDLVPYQKERWESTELEKAFEERVKYLKEQGVDLNADHLIKPKNFKGSETEWQTIVKSMKDSKYYHKLAELESEQLVKEQRNREQSHQYAIPGENIVKSSVTRGMAQLYENQL